MLLDAVVSAEVVLANGDLVTASNTSNTDLFWVCDVDFPAVAMINWIAIGATRGRALVWARGGVEVPNVACATYDRQLRDHVWATERPGDGGELRGLGKVRDDGAQRARYGDGVCASNK